MHRRRFIHAGLGLSAWSLSGCGGGGESHMGGTGGMAGMPQIGGTLALREGEPLPALARLQNENAEPGVLDATLTAAPARVQLVAGTTTEVWAYNGIIPGPLIEAREGDRVRIRFVNRLPDQDSTIHWHGMPVPPDQDGNPMDPVSPGASRAYEFVLPVGSAGTYWYHPHPHRVTHEQVFRGLAGMFIVRPEVDPLPPDIEDIPLVISDLRLNRDGSIAPNTVTDFWNGREGDALLVNGSKNPVVSIVRGRIQRWRIVNATNARYLRLALEGHPFTLVGLDGGLFGAPVAPVSEILLAPAERAEVLVTGTQSAATRATLHALPYDRGFLMAPGMGSVNAQQSIPILTIAYQSGAVLTPPIPTTLRTIAALGSPRAVKRLVLSERMTGMMGVEFLINGAAFDPNRVDLVSRAGEVELWEIVNATSMDHPVHLHGTQFQVADRSRNGQTVPEPLLAWKDTVNSRAGETVRIKIVQSIPGKRMFHCHILEHEDLGMMGVLEVV